MEDDWQDDDDFSQLSATVRRHRIVVQRGALSLLEPGDVAFEVLVRMGVDSSAQQFTLEKRWSNFVELHTALACASGGARGGSGGGGGRVASRLPDLPAPLRKRVRIKHKPAAAALAMSLDAYLCGVLAVATTRESKALAAFLSPVEATVERGSTSSAAAATTAAVLAAAAAAAETECIFGDDEGASDGGGVGWADGNSSEDGGVFRSHLHP